MISVILINHNYAQYIKSCLNSILENNQEIIGEILIINDSSSDNSEEIIKHYLKNSKIKYFKVNFKSLPMSYNFGIKNSNFPLITKIDADDLFEKNFIDDYYTELRNKKCDLIFGNLKIIDEKMNLIKIKNQTQRMIGSKLSYPVGSGTIFKKTIWKQIGGFDEKLKYQDDYDCWLKINKIKDLKFGVINNSGYKYRMHKLNMSKSFVYKNLSKIYVLLKNI